VIVANRVRNRPEARAGQLPRGHARYCIVVGALRSPPDLRIMVGYRVTCRTKRLRRSRISSGKNDAPAVSAWFKLGAGSAYHSTFSELPFLRPFPISACNREL